MNLSIFSKAYSDLALNIQNSGSTSSFKKSLVEKSMVGALKKTKEFLEGLSIGEAFNEIDHISKLRKDLTRIQEQEHNICAKWGSEKTFFGLSSGLYKISWIKKLYCFLTGDTQLIEFHKERQLTLSAFTQTLRTIDFLVTDLLNAKDPLFDKDSPVEIASHPITISKQSKNVFNKLITNEATKKLYEAAGRSKIKGVTGNWSINNHKYDQTSPKVFTNTSQRTLCVRDDLSEGQALSYLIYELIMITNIPRINRLNTQLSQGKIDSKTYLRGVEKIKKDAKFKHHVLGREVLKNEDNKEMIDLFQNRNATNCNAVMSEYDKGVDVDLSLSNDFSSIKPKIDSSSVDKEKLQKVLSKMMSCDAAKDLYVSAHSVQVNDKKGSWKIKIINNEPNDVNSFGAGCSFLRRVISLSNLFSENQMLAALVFELTNALSSQKFANLEQDALLGKVSREEYVKLNEQIEFEGTLKHHEIMQKAIEDNGWDHSVDLFKDHVLYKNFEDYWTDIKTGAHAEYYGNFWDKCYKSEWDSAQSLTSLGQAGK